MNRNLLTALLATTVAWSTLAWPSSLPALAAADKAVASAVSLPVEHFKLDNGLNVYLSPNALEPRFSARVVVNAGGKQDPEDATGIAHYLEHMLFKGTDELGTSDFSQEKPLLDEITRLYSERFKETDEAKRLALQKQINQLSVQAGKYAIPGEFDRLYSALGAQGLNAYTNQESTVYVVDLPKNRLENWAMIESERFKDAVFRLFQSELETVYEEKNRSLDNKERALSDAVMQQLFQKHPYGQRTVLGTVEHLKNPSLEKMYAFYHRYYVPNNMALVLSGDFDPAEAKRLIKTYFGTWKRSSVPAFHAPKEPALQGVRRVTVPYKGEEKAMIAFRTVPYRSEDRLPLSMIDMLLDNSETGLINLNLVTPQKVRGAGSYPDIRKDGGAEVLWGIPAAGQTPADVERLLLTQVERLKKGEFDESTIQAIALNQEVALKRVLEGNEGRVDMLTEAFLQEQDPAAKLKEVAHLRKLTKNDIMRVAHKYFGSEYVVGWRVDQEPQFPKIAKPDLEKVPLDPDRQSPFAQRVEQVKVKPVQPHWVDYDKDFSVKSYDLGVLQYHVQNPVSDLFDLTISYDFGGKHYPNFADIMSELNWAGTGKLSSDDVAKRFYAMGVSHSFEVGDYGFAVKLSGPDENFEKAVALAEQVLWHGKLDESHLKAKIANRLQNRVDSKKNVATVRSALGEYVRFGERSGFIDRPSGASLLRLTSQGYPRMVEQLKKQNFQIQYTGRLPMDRVTAILKQHHEPKHITVPLLRPRLEPPLTLEHRHDSPVKIYFTHHPSVQAFLDVVVPGEPVNTRDRVVCDLYNEYFDGGMGAILFQEVREARSLAYSSSAAYVLGQRLGDQDQMFGNIGTQADKAVEALKLFIDLLKAPPRSQAPFDRAVESVGTQYASNVIPFRSVVDAVQTWAELGYDRDPRPARLAELKRRKLDDVFAYLQAKITKRPLTFTVVGDRTKIDLEGLKKLGDFEEVPLEKLFTD